MSKLVITFLLVFVAMAQAAERSHVSAQAKLVLPPAEYDHPYTGQLSVQMNVEKDVLRKACPDTPNPIGCSVHNQLFCIIYVASEKILKAEPRKLTPEIVKRHEVGHCNGWPSGHPNARSLDGKTK